MAMVIVGVLIMVIGICNIIEGRKEEKTSGRNAIGIILVMIPVYIMALGILDFASGGL